MIDYFNRKIGIVYRIVERLENVKISLFGCFLTFISMVFIRNYLEIFASGKEGFGHRILSQFFHFPLFYIFAFLSFIALNHLLTKEKIEKITRISIFLTPIILIPPLIDLAIFKGSYIAFEYQHLSQTGFLETIKLFPAFLLYGPLGILNFWGHTLCLGNHCDYFSQLMVSTYGSRIEFSLMIFFFVSYIFLKTKSIFKTFVAILGGYFIMYLLTYFTTFFSYFFPSSQAAFNFSQAQVVASLFFVFSIFLIAYWYYAYDKIKFEAIIRNIRLPRLGLYLVSLFFGVALARRNLYLGPTEWLIVLVTSLAITFSWLVAVGSNDLVDEETDKISNQDRPLPAGKLTREEVKSLNIFFRVVSYMLAYLAGFGFFLTILVRSVIAYLYSNPPFRLKKIPFISTLCIAAGTLLGFMGGFVLLGDKDLLDFPPRLILLILAVFTLSINVIHIKDYEGDKKDRVWTILVIFGLRKGKIIVGILSGISFLIPVLLYPENMKLLLAPSILAGALSFYLINRRNFQEKMVLILYYVYTIPVLLIILF